MIVGTNTTSAFTLSSGSTAGVVPQAYTGSTDANPFIADSPQTPDIVGLAGGADAYGLLGVDAATLINTAVTANAPAGRKPSSCACKT